MSLSTRQRTSIFQKLVPVLGEEDADTLMAQFPATELDVLVTREHLRAEFAEFRVEFESRLGRVESRLDGVEARLGRVEARLDGVEAQLGRMATKDDLAAMERMATKDDLDAAMERMVTKDDLAQLRLEFAELRSELHAHINRAMGAMIAVSVAAMGTLAAIF